MTMHAREHAEGHITSFKGVELNLTPYFHSVMKCGKK